MSLSTTKNAASRHADNDEIETTRVCGNRLKSLGEENGLKGGFQTPLVDHRGREESRNDDEYFSSVAMAKISTSMDAVNITFPGLSPVDHDRDSHRSDALHIHCQRPHDNNNPLDETKRGEEVEDASETRVDETEEDQIRREIEDSEALARHLMAEEAMASYSMSTEFLRDNADQFSSEDLAALHAAMAEEDPDVEVEDDEVGEIEVGMDSQEMSYDALLRLGERIGDVKEERWALVAHEKIQSLPTLFFEKQLAEGKGENHTEVKCLVCQFSYEEGDELRRLPCQHCFHKDCVDTWLQTKDTCAYCRKTIVPSKVVSEER